MKQFSKRLFFVLSLVFCTAIVFGQERTITGTVRDNNGNPLANVSYLIKGTTTGGVTDEKGNFSIKANRGAVIAFSSVGFTTKEVQVADQNNLSIELSSSAGELNEVVVTALGIRRERRSVGYAVSTIKAEELTKAGVTMNPFLALYGKAAGVGVNTGHQALWAD